MNFTPLQSTNMPPLFFDSYLSSYETHIASLRAFNTRFGALIPEELRHLITAYIGPDHAAVTVYCPSDPDQRSQMLAFVGHTFGVTDWTSTPEKYSSYFNWTRTIDGICVTITNAEEKPPELPRPVRPSSFPLMLERSPGKVQSSGQYEDDYSIDEDIDPI